MTKLALPVNLGAKRMEQALSVEVLRQPTLQKCTLSWAWKRKRASPTLAGIVGFRVCILKGPPVRSKVKYLRLSIQKIGLYSVRNGLWGWDLLCRCCIVSIVMWGWASLEKLPLKLCSESFGASAYNSCYQRITRQNNIYSYQFIKVFILINQFYSYDFYVNIQNK